MNKISSKYLEVIAEREWRMGVAWLLGASNVHEEAYQKVDKCVRNHQYLKYQNEKELLCLLNCQNLLLKVFSKFK